MTRTELPIKSIVLYCHYGSSLYVNGLLVHHEGPGAGLASGVRLMCDVLGLKLEIRHVRWEDWPGQKEDSSAVHHPPERLEVVERHFAELEKQKRLDQIKHHRAELDRLEREAAR